MSRTEALGALLVLLLPAIVPGCDRARAQSAPAFAQRQSVGEPVQPLPSTLGTPVPLGASTAPPLVDAPLPTAIEGRKFVASAAGMAYAEDTGGNRLHAIDVRRGTERWVSGDDVEPASAVAGDRLVFVAGRYGGGTAIYALSVRTGRRVARIADAYPGSVVDGVLYARHGGRFAAYDAATAAKRWETLGGGEGGGASAVRAGSVLLQDFADSGAITVDDMYAFDAVHGRPLWHAGYGPHPLGFAPGVVYLDATWFPLQLDEYHPLEVETVDLRRGTVLHHFSYAPDPERNGILPGENVPHTHGHRGARVAGGYVYIQIEQTWYRYDADREPAEAHPVELAGIALHAWLGDALLVSDAAGVALATVEPDRLVLHRVGRGPLRSPVAAGRTGTRYAVVGDALVAFGPSGRDARMLGRVRCATVSGSWRRATASRCAAVTVKARPSTSPSTANPSPSDRWRPRANAEHSAGKKPALGVECPRR